MTDSQNLSIPSDPVVPQPAVWMAHLGSRLEDLSSGATAPAVPAPVVSPQIDNQLVQVRLGVASSLYVALRAKHAATASHSLRMAMTGSAWATAMDLAGPQRDALEVAALLHDVGVIGLPDKILLKPGPLDDDELRIVEDARRNLGVEILRVACAEPAILQIVENVGAWYDGFRGGFSCTGTQIPFGAAHDLDPGSLRRHDQRPGLPSGGQPGAGDGGALPDSGKPVRSGAGAELRGVDGLRSVGIAAGDRPALAPAARSGGSQLLLGVEPAVGGGPGGPGRVALPDAAVGQHARRRDLRQRQSAGAAMEPRGRAVDGDLRIERAAAALVAGVADPAQ